MVMRSGALSSWKTPPELSSQLRPEALPGEAYNIDSGQEVTIAQLASVVREQVDPSLNVAFDPSWPSGEAHRVASIDKLVSLGFVPAFGLDEGVRRTVAWRRQNAT